MKHYASRAFWVLRGNLPEEVRSLADKNFELLKVDPRHPSLRFKRVGQFWSVRVGSHYRALGQDVADGIQWFWIGSHADYDKSIGPVSRGNSHAWQRGRYLVETLGHCGECHSPRGVLGQVDRDRPLAGNSELGRFAAPDITPQGLAARGWDGTPLREYLATGASAIAVASDEMLHVVNLSTSRLSARDLDAMTIYLLGDAPPAPDTPANVVTSVAARAEAVGQRHYFDLCAGCHGRDGGGVPNVAVRLRANSSVRDPSPHNLIVAVLDGLPEHDFPGLARMQDMPGFAADLDDAEVAALATWLRQQFGGQSALVDAASVRELRR